MSKCDFFHMAVKFCGNHGIRKNIRFWTASHFLKLEEGVKNRLTIVGKYAILQKSWESFIKTMDMFSIFVGKNGCPTSGGGISEENGMSASDHYTL